MKRILFTGGGSAGHVAPNIAIMEELTKRGDIDLCYMGGNGIEKKMVSTLKIPYYSLSAPKLIRGGGFSAFKNNILIPFRLKKAIQEAKRGLLVCRPDLIFSKGGYISLPVILAAKKLNIPCFAHESDLSVGLTTKLTEKHCISVFTSFPETAKKLKNGVYSGAPIRERVTLGDREQTRKKYGVKDGEKVLLVFGGGSGSLAINTAVRKHIKKLTEKYTIFHICGENNLVKSNIRGYIQEEFVADMGGVYAMCDGILCRAGAGAVFEAIALRKPTIFVPLIGATRGDQTQNAEYFKNKGLCHLLEQENLDGICEAVDGLFTDEQLGKRLKESVYRNGRVFIAERLVEFLKK